MKKFTALLLALTLCLGLSTLALAEDYMSETLRWSYSRITVDKAQLRGQYGTDYHVPVGAVFTYDVINDGPFCLTKSETDASGNWVAVHWSYDPAAGALVKNEVIDELSATIRSFIHQDCPKLSAGETYKITLTAEAAADFATLKQSPSVLMAAGRLVDNGPEYKGPIYIDYPDETPSAPETPSVPETPAEPETPVAPAGPASVAYPSTQTVDLDGAKVEFQMYALHDQDGNPTNYVKVRDLALALNGTAAQFAVDWDGSVNLVAGTAYTPNGSENATPFSGERAYTIPENPTNVNGAASDLQAIVLTDDGGGAYTYYQLRDLGRKLGFNVDWSAEKGVFIETGKPYSGT